MSSTKSTENCLFGAGEGEVHARNMNAYALSTEVVFLVVKCSSPNPHYL